MATDWKERLKELGKEFFPGQGEKKKVYQPTKPILKPENRETSPDEMMKAIFPTQIMTIKAPSLTPIMEDSADAAPTSTKTGKIPLPREPKLTGERITVGLDWGTSFTKVCIRKELGGDDIPIYPIEFESGSLPQTNSLLCPSFALTKDEKIYFGNMALSLISKGRGYQHLKVCLACKSENSRPSCVSSEICPFEDTVLVSHLTTAYLAWVMKEARQRAPGTDRKRELSFIYNVGVPVKHLDDGEGSRLLKIYRKIAFNAWRISEGMSQGIRLSTISSWLDQLDDDDKEIPAATNSPVLLAPEASAAILSYLNSTDSTPGLYCILDIGAWTADISFFRLTDIAMLETGVQRIAYYAADVWRNATNDIDDKLIRCLMELGGIKSIIAFEGGDPISFVRMMREKGSLCGAAIDFTTESQNHDHISIPSYVVDYAKGVVSEAMRRNFSKTLKRAREVEPSIDKWKNFTMFVTGGGSNEVLFPEKIRERCIALDPDIRNDIISFPTMQRNADATVFSRLAVAAGLSYPLPVWPEQLLWTKITKGTPKKERYIPPVDDEPG